MINFVLLLKGRRTNTSLRHQFFFNYNLRRNWTIYYIITQSKVIHIYIYLYHVRAIIPSQCGLLRTNTKILFSTFFLNSIDGKSIYVHNIIRTLRNEDNFFLLCLRNEKNIAYRTECKIYAMLPVLCIR